MLIRVSDLKSQQKLWKVRELQRSGNIHGISLEVRENTGLFIAVVNRKDITVLLNWRIRYTRTSHLKYFITWLWIGVAEWEEKVISIFFTKFCH